MHALRVPFRALAADASPGRAPRAARTRRGRWRALRPRHAPDRPGARPVRPGGRGLRRDRDAPAAPGGRRRRLPCTHPRVRVRSHLWASHVAADRGPRLRVLGARAAYVKHGLDVQAAQLQAGMRPGDEGFGDEPPDAWGALRAGEQSRPVPTEPGNYAGFYAGVAATLRDGTDPPVALDDGIHGLRVIEAAFAERRARAASCVSPARRPSVAGLSDAGESGRPARSSAVEAIASRPAGRPRGSGRPPPVQAGWRPGDLDRKGCSTMFDVAAAAVEAALAAGARYADARVMHRRTESMSARNGEIEDLTQRRGRPASAYGPWSARPGASSRCPTSTDAAAAPGRRSARPRSPRRAPPVPGPAVDAGARRRCVSGSWASRVRRVDPLSVPLAEKGDLLVGVTATMRARRRRPGRGRLPGLGHPQVVRLQRGPPHRPAHPGVRRGMTRHRDRRRRDPAPVLPGVSAASTAPAAGSWSRARPARHTPSGSPRRRRRC